MIVRVFGKNAGIYLHDFSDQTLKSGCIFHKTYFSYLNVSSQNSRDRCSAILIVRQFNNMLCQVNEV